MKIIKSVWEQNGIDHRSFNLQRDLTALHQAALKMGDVLMVSIDPITAYMGVGPGLIVIAPATFEPY